MWEMEANGRPSAPLSAAQALRRLGRLPPSSDARMRPAGADAWRRLNVKDLMLAREAAGLGARAFWAQAAAAALAAASVWLIVAIFEHAAWQARIAESPTEDQLRARLEGSRGLGLAFLALAATALPAVVAYALWLTRLVALSQAFSTPPSRGEGRAETPTIVVVKSFKPMRLFYQQRRFVRAALRIGRASGGAAAVDLWWILAMATLASWAAAVALLDSGDAGDPFVIAAAAGTALTMLAFLPVVRSATRAMATRALSGA